ncbi:hypothetical protein M2302_005269 [Micromonospora sp. A200]|uniref:hypothetical protein n=1 Tax=Micromonospora sp. A200 TaxID=2940568 RepID=UPI002476698A|nr:hypothetical protein [Micromonospora sp. A200]MDH6465068.1 hypothetical protein [Micromonospora sp. A200]
MNDGYALTVTWASDDATDATVCGECGVIAVRRDSQVWEHPAALRERFSRDVCAQPCSGRPPKPRELTFGRGNQVKKDKYSLRSPLADAATAPGAAITVGCSGFYKVNTKGPIFHPISWGYVADNGEWALGTATQPKGVVGDRALGADLRAVFWALEHLPAENSLTVLTSSQEVVDLIDKWRAGSEEMPPGYTLERDSGFQPKMLMLAQQFAADPDWLQVRQASGNRLQLAARALAQTARLYAIKEIAKDAAYEAAEGHARWALEGRGHSEG